MITSSYRNAFCITAPPPFFFFGVGGGGGGVGGGVEWPVSSVFLKEPVMQTFPEQALNKQLICLQLQMLPWCSYEVTRTVCVEL